MARDGQPMLADTGDRFRAPVRVLPVCGVWACDREAYAVLEGTDNIMLCAEHWCRFYLVTLLFLGDAKAHDKWLAIVDKVREEVGGDHLVLGVGPGTLPAAVVSRADEWRCAECGGGLTQGPRGMWHHRCEKEQRRYRRDVSEGARIAERNHHAAEESASAEGDAV